MDPVSSILEKHHHVCPYRFSASSFARASVDTQGRTLKRINQKRKHCLSVFSHDWCAGGAQEEGVALFGADLIDVHSLSFGIGVYCVSCHTHEHTVKARSKNYLFLHAWILK